MLARIRKAQEGKESGFTLIELLVVMIIIGILAAIAIPAFLSQRDKARATAVKSDATTIGKEIASYFVDGTVTTALTITTTGTAPNQSWSFNTTPPTTGRLSQNNVSTGTIASESNWCVTVRNTTVDTTAPVLPATGKATWSYNSAGALTAGVCPP